jgi:hypothetical protein
MVALYTDRRRTKPRTPDGPQEPTPRGPSWAVLSVNSEKARARTTKIPAAPLTKSQHTVTTQRQAIQAKPGARNLPHAVALAYRRSVL